MKTLNRVNYSIIPLFFLNRYMLTYKAYFLILFAPKDIALEENQAKNSIFKNKLFSFWVIHGYCYFSLLCIVGDLGSSFREEGMNDYINVKKKAISYMLININSLF